MEQGSIHIPIDRRRAMARGRTLPTQATGSVLFADISGFTPLTATLLQELGKKRGPEEITRQLNYVYDALITQVHNFGGSVIGFAGDAITCWFNADNSLRATACALAMQQAMDQFTSITTPNGTQIPLAMKAAVAAGPVRRFLIGTPATGYIDTLAGAPLNRMSAAEHLANRGEVIVAPEVVTQLGDTLTVTEYRTDEESEQRFAAVTGLTTPVPPTPWPDPIPKETLTTEQIRPWLFAPVFERLQSGQGQFLAEIRPATALFLRFGGLDFDNDPQVEQKLSTYVDWVQQTLAQHEGFLLQLTIGDKGSYLYAAFGAPIAHDNDPERAVAAALQLVNIPRELYFVDSVQIGISRGRMRAGAYGGKARSTYGVLGDEVNMAARLMGLAGPGQIFISQPVADAVTSRYSLDYLGPTKVKGKDEPIPVYRLQGKRQRGNRGPINNFPNPLVGREETLVQITNLLAAADSRGQIVRIQGEAGIGKSHLAATVAERALHESWRVLLGACQSTDQDVPYYPWRQIFSALFVLLDDPNIDRAAQTERHIEQVAATISNINPDWLVRLPLLGDLLNLPIADNPTTAAFTPQLRQEALFTFATDLIEYWANNQPLFLLIEDIHWLDESSRKLTLAVARVISQTPAMLVVVHRPPLERDQPVLPELEQPENYSFLNLDELSTEATAAVVTHRLQGQPSPLLLDIIQLQARGNPFFIEEFTAALLELGHLTQQTGDGQWNLSKQIVDTIRKANCLTTNSSGQTIFNRNASLSAADLGLPDSIHGLVLARLDKLLEDQKLTLKVASVIGRIFQFQLLSNAHPLKTSDDTLLEQITEIEAREFIRQENPLPHLAHIFRHNITRDIFYETMLERQQKELHRAVATAIEEVLPDAVEQLAYHYSHAQAKDKAVFYLDKAARKAQREYANETALNYYTQALAFEDRWEWHKGQVEVLHILGRREEEQAEIAALAALPDAPPYEIANLLGEYYEAVGDYPQAQIAVEQALEIARANGNQLAEAHCLSQLGLIARRQGIYQQAQTHYMDVLTLFPAEDSYTFEESQVLIQSLNGLGITLRQQGNFGQANLYYNWGLTLSRTNNNLRDEAKILNSLGVTAFYLRNLTQAKSYYQQALEIQYKIGDRGSVGTTLNNLAMTVRNAGDYDQAKLYYGEALAIHQTTGNRWEEVNILNSMGVFYQEVGDFATSESYLKRGIALAREIGDEVGVAYLTDNLGLVAYEGQNFAAAEQLLRKGLEIADKHNETHLITNLLYHMSMASLRLGHLEQAAEQAQSSLELRQSLDMRLATTGNLAILGKIYAATNELSLAQDYVMQTLAILDECQGEGPEFPQLDYFLCYQVLSTVGKVTQGKLVLKAAYEMAMARAGKISDPSLQQSFLENVATNREIVAAYEQKMN